MLGILEVFMRTEFESLEETDSRYYESEQSMDWSPKQEQYKESMVATSHASSYPRAMMVMNLYAHVTSAAVERPWRTKNFASLTKNQTKSVLITVVKVWLIC